MATTVFINEFHYDNSGADVGEFIEIAGPAGTDLTSWKLVLYNGGSGGIYDSIPLSGTITNQSNGFGTLSFSRAGIQNGPTDGFALVDPSGKVVQFLSYEGSLTATSGSAVGMVSMDIGVSESTPPPAGQSLQLTGSGNTYEDFTWSGPKTETPGGLNGGQTFVSAPLPVINLATTQASAAEAGPVLGIFTITRTGSTAAALTVAYTINAASTATSGEDFVPLPGSIEIPAGQASATIIVTPIDDDRPEGNELLFLTLANNSAYSLDSHGSGAAIAIADNDPIVKNSFFFTEDRILSIQSAAPTRLKALVTGKADSQIGEIIAISVDDAQGSIDGLLPGDTGYAAKAQENAQLLLAVLADQEFGFLTQENVLTVAGGQFLQFALLSGGSLDDLRRGGSVEMLFATSEVNPDGQSALQTTSIDLQTIDLAFRFPRGGFGDVNLRLTLGDFEMALGSQLQGKSSESEIIDLTGIGAPVVNVTMDVYREAAFDNSVGFYLIEDMQGRVRDPLTNNLLEPGEAGYVQAALANRVGVTVTGRNDQVTRYSAQIAAGHLLTTFLVVGGTVEDLLDDNANNNPMIYFNHISANSDGIDHVRTLGANLFGYEDLAGGGDRDFNDVIVQVNIASI
ncbi:hypothetical protein C7271_07385 [filamentous cyanobacterium CCP5]|nr:hypothetical protein C7271_07385 [filamentous cyanobacterium CCP5]